DARVSSQEEIQAWGDRGGTGGCVIRGENQFCRSYRSLRRHLISPTLAFAMNFAAAYLFESFPFLGFFFSRFCLFLLMKEVCHDFPVSRSATQPDTRFVAVMIGRDAHEFEREFSRLEVHKRTKSQSTAASRRECFG